MDPNQLASVVEDVLADSAPTRVPLNLDGAVYTAEWLERWAQNRAYTGCHKNVPFSIAYLSNESWIPDPGYWINVSLRSFFSIIQTPIP